MSTRFCIALALAASLAATAPAFAIKGGATSHDPVGIRQSVVQIKGPGGTQCTGTVIAKRLVLTAAHCFLAGRGDYKIRALNPKFRFRFAMATQVAVHPDFDVRALGTGAPLNDLALLRADRDFPDWLVPVALASSVPGDNQFVDVVAAGYGMNRDRRVASAGTLREMHFAMLDKVYDPSKQLFLIDREGKLKPRTARTGVCRGDSGGPVFRRTASGTVLVGVISAVIAGRGYDCGAITAVTAVSAYRGFIQDMARKAGASVVFR
jgi:secreted trypsin-like serine protease